VPEHPSHSYCIVLLVSLHLHLHSCHYSRRSVHIVRPLRWNWRNCICEWFSVIGIKWHLNIRTPNRSGSAFQGRSRKWASLHILPSPLARAAFHPRITTHSPRDYWNLRAGGLVGRATFDVGGYRELIVATANPGGHTLQAGIEVRRAHRMIRPRFPSTIVTSNRRVVDNGER
jgi:hypothetical protein